ncbi:MAG: hypothetical protein ACYSUQ_14510 [Planctomycetota bacterium]|jgi:HAMP domain-containing protein
MRRDDADQNDSVSSRRRRKYLIKPAFQWKYAITAAVLVCLLASIMSTVLYGVLHQQARLRSLNPETYTAAVAPVILLSGVAFAALTALAVGAWCIVVTHRICGPLFVLERYLGQLAKGRFPTLRPLRKKDEFKELHITVAKTIDALKARKRAQLGALTKAVRLAESASGGGGCDRENAMVTLASHLEKLRAAACVSLGQDPLQTSDASQPGRNEHRAGLRPERSAPALASSGRR